VKDDIDAAERFRERWHVTKIGGDPLEAAPFEVRDLRATATGGTHIVPSLSQEDREVTSQEA